MTMLPNSQEPAAPIEVVQADDDVAERFAKGELARLLGLSKEHLNIGLSVARNHLMRGAPAEALKIYLGLVFCQPSNPEFQVGLANCANAMGEHPLAVQAASVVIALAPSDPRGYLLSARGCLAMGSLDEAREDLADALKFAQATGDTAIAAEATRLLSGIAATQA